MAIIRSTLVTILFICFCSVSSGCTKKDSSGNAVQIKGSDTEVNLVQKLAEVFMKESPETAIAVTGGGSGTGIAALINGQTDIANSSRPFSEDEMKRAGDRGIDPVAVVFAVDALALIVHEDLPVDSLTIEDLAELFKGGIANWSAVGGGPDAPVSLYGRQSNSGTFMYFRETVLKGNYARSMKRMNGTAQIVEAVRQDRGGIGYVGVGYVMDQQKRIVPGIKILSLRKDRGAQAVSPLSPGNVQSGLYPVSRPLYQYTNGLPRDRLLDFLRFELSPEGQAMVALEGYYPVTGQYMELNRRNGIVK
jgi:phosphate transport system substrate-binding protein